jgi:hypothetical protein
MSNIVPTEPADKSIVVFEDPVDMDVYFRDDDLAEQARASSGSDDDEHWFPVNDYDGDPLCWASVLRAHPDLTPALLVRTPLGGVR